LALPLSSTEPAWLAGDGIDDLVSVIIPTFNRSAMTLELLDNLAAQTWPHVEVIVIDDGSSDDTRQAVNRWIERHPERAVTLRSQPNGGPGSARNLGLTMARGAYLHFIDSDDLLYPFALQRMVSALRMSGRPYCLATIETAGADGIPVRLDFEGKPCLASAKVLQCRWMTHAALYRRAAVAAAGPFNTALRVGEDTEFQWRIVARNAAGQVIDESIGVRREHGQGHLSVGRSQAQISRTNIEVFRSHFDWALATGHLTPEAAWSVALSCLNAGLILAYRDDRRSADLAFATIAEARKFGAWWAPLAIAISWPGNRIYYAMFYYALGLAKCLRNGWRWCLSRLHWRILGLRSYPLPGYSPSKQMQ
jgi:glycosyltransferase involved in cell wall biosynthesis